MNCCSKLFDLRCRLLQELIESYQLNQTLLRQVLEEQKTQTMIFKEFVEKKSRSCTPEVFVSQSDSAVDTGDGSDSVDEGEALKLREWVAARGLPSVVTNALLSHCYVLTDLLQHAQREDIAKLNLKGGIELRLWRAIQEHRLHSSPAHLRRSSSTETDGDAPLLLLDPTRTRARRAPSTASACSNNPTIVIRDQVNGDDSVAPYYGDAGLNL
ncbi:hypothetical protein HF086_003678 [Spodoptera exigua]|uniref:SAM domain-containing protein n=1 Tax=Spodoptera exigua TaxID=7107 RepID=A0A922M1P7_SPOEX|nr:hypothetical protein HF086_003678 [Spodoptera exigua]